MILIHVRKQKGFSLIEVLIAMTVLGLIAAGVSSLLLNQINTSAYLDDKASRRDLKIEIDRLFADANACLETLDTTILTSTVGGIQDLGNLVLKDKNGNGIFLNSSYDRINLKGSTLRNLDIGSTTNRGFTELQLHLERQRNGGGPKELESLRYKLRTNINPTTREILACSMFGEDNKSDCLRPVQTRSLPATVPSNIDAIEIVIASASGNWDEGGPGGGSNSCTVPGTRLFLKLDGVLNDKFISGKLAEEKPSPSGGLRLSNKEYMYNGVLVGKNGSCNRWSTTPAEAIYDQSIDVCRKSGDPKLATGSGIIFYRFNSSLE